MTHTLPDLPYAYDALEPHIDAETVKIHHDLHHAGYVKGLNAAEEKLKAAVDSSDFASIKAIEKDLAFHGSGHLLHSIYWTNMGGQGGPATGKIAELIDAEWGSFDKFKAHFSASTAAVEGSGWGLLCLRKSDNKLVVLQSEIHQNLTQWGVIPLLVCDVWEHAYYLKYQNKRPGYIEAWWNVINWDDVNKRLEQ